LSGFAARISVALAITASPFSNPAKEAEAPAPLFIVVFGESYVKVV
jgi:hypothetical protein